MAIDEDSTEISSGSHESNPKGMSGCPFFEASTDVASSSQDKKGKDSSECPVMGGFSFTSAMPSFGICQGPQRISDHSQTHTSSTSEVTIKSKHAPSSRIMSLLEGLNEPVNSGNPPEHPTWLDRQLFDRGREFYRRYLFCLSFSELLSLVLMLSADRALRPLIYTGQSDTPHKALKRYFSTLLHIVTWYKGDVWDPEDDAHKDIMTIRSVHDKVATLCNSSEENERVTNVQVKDKGHSEPAFPLYTSIRQDLTPQLESKLTFLDPGNAQHYISQWDMSLTQYSFMGLLLAHPEKLGAGAATDEEFAGLIHFWRGIGWLLGIEDKYNFCSGSVAETRSLCLEVERLFALPMLAEADWNYEHMAISLMSGMSFIIPFLSFSTMFRYLAHTINISVPSFVKRMSFQQCFHYWFMRLLFGLLVIFPKMITVLSYRFSNMISHVHGKSAKKLRCPKVTCALGKNYS